MIETKQKIGQIKEILKDNLTQTDLDIVEDYLYMVLTVPDIKGFTSTKSIIQSHLSNILE